MMRRNRYLIISIGIMLLACFIALLLSFQSKGNEELIDGYSIMRDQPQGDKKTVTLRVNSPEDEAQVTLQIEAQRYTEGEIQKLAEEAEDISYHKMLGENVSAEYVDHDLVFSSRIEGYPFSIKYECDSMGMIDGTGKLNADEITRRLETDDTFVQIKIMLFYDDFRCENSYGLYLYPPKTEQSFEERVLKAIKEQEMLSATDAVLTLPKEVDGSPLYYEEHRSSDGIWILLLGFLASITYYLGKSREDEKKKKLAQEEMLRDYPAIIHRYAIYYQSGMNTKAIWKQICDDYDVELLCTKKKRTAYENMKLAYQRMNDGKSEREAYELFAKDCGGSKYRVFVNLVLQAAEKGRAKLGEQLIEESREAFEERRRAAKRLGEEASSKLLLPMFLMFVVVMLIVMVPALFRFRV